TVSVGVTAPDGSYQVQVNCSAAGTGTVFVDGVATSTTFSFQPGTIHTGINATIANTPIITSLSPTVGPVSGGAVISVTGANFIVGNTAVAFVGPWGSVGGSNVTVATSTFLTVTAPAVAYAAT